MVIALDGPAGAGKSTVSRLLAKTLGFIYLDTGAMYRAIAWALRNEDLRLSHDAPSSETLQQLPLRFSLQDGELAITYRGKQLNEELREPDITNMASRISQVPAVRVLLTQRQRELAETGNLVAEGRDMTTVVFPETPFKVFLTADIATRARRRQLEYRQKGLEMEYSLLEAQIRARDQADEQRSLAPLRPAPDAFILDTSAREPADVVSQLLAFYRKKTANRSVGCEKT
jgi:CMP/dCMP kinase